MFNAFIYGSSDNEQTETVPREFPECTTNFPDPKVFPHEMMRFQRIPGYEDIFKNKQLGDVFIYPPKKLGSISDLSAIQNSHSPFDFNEDYFGFDISVEEAKEALINNLSNHCCYGTSKANDLEIYKMSPYNSIHYTLETFTESRSISWDQEPYKGQKLTSAPNENNVPMPWEVHCNPTQMFKEEVRFVEVPNTSSITVCYACTSQGYYKCNCCCGKGMKRCINCSGSGRYLRLDSFGHRQPDSCWHCHGTGRKRCSTCCGDGKVMCQICQGYRNLKCFIKLRIQYETHLTDHVLENRELPEDLVMTASGNILVDETQPRLNPLRDFAEEIASLSETTLNDHLINAKKSRILMQRQRIRIVSITECSYTWDDQEYRFWLFGREMQVFAPDYPQKFCWSSCCLLS